MLDDWLMLALYGLATMRGAILISSDEITRGIREQIYYLSPPANDASKDWWYQDMVLAGKGNKRPRSAKRGIGYLYTHKGHLARRVGLLGSLISCASCTGVWVALGFYAANHYYPDVASAVAAVLALAMFPHYATKKGWS